jgi:hypothetical protein
MLIVGYGEEVMSNGTKMKVSLIVMLDSSFSTFTELMASLSFFSSTGFAVTAGAKAGERVAM